MSEHSAESDQVELLATTLHDTGICNAMFSHYGPAKKCVTVARTLIERGWRSEKGAASNAELVRRINALADEIERWEWLAPVGPGNASYANGYENGRRSVSADLRALADAASPPAGAAS